MSNLQFTYKYLVKVETSIIRQMQAILMSQNRNASGKLYQSLNQGMEIDQTENGFTLELKYGYMTSNGRYNVGDLVLDGRRRVTKNPSYNKLSPRDPSTAIGQMINWILRKGISVGGGKIRTPLKKTYVKKVKGGGKQAIINEKYAANVEATASPDRELVSFAFAIFKNIKKRGRTAAGNTNFLKPYQNLLRNQTFKIGLVQALSKDGIGIFAEQIKKGNIKEIKIIM